ncbi:hypothetical protein O6H91_12G043700 [Diphasiastrum complanatum]|uniref:Uncharacterized protein n=6 Tax=Diphasiastrum complanatum TaxID=34168 RepID=A0ACC2C129_DIPCM|nr:hypothetical protein O6H91_12G043700 [Diphasiastrum complanatum]KAJ7535720.1 hypothetical protein O6H91_12G043700 [Diphasiastrum complanatum]KAJ7535721.1 hypothetical protein O6H91_12G043700 [Diphasiastrum complanatum]KAJ7535722.1 hypothetical protein O6H91_12G043700 [Diphasiastrum complanatum]KAJ7535723.1 hypothetical protein O6H91_12G043700 [Diphasiastrum complanatum]
MAEEGEKVILHVYDLSQGLARQLSASFLGKAIEGIWHTGIVVYGHEFYFGGGIQSCRLGLTPYGKPLRVIDLGLTQVPKEVFEDYIHEITPRYTAQTYNLLRHNCNNFTDEISQFLVGVGVPEYILRLPEEVSNSPMGALLMPMIEHLETTLKYGGVPQVPQFIASSGPDLASAQLQSQVVSMPKNGQSETGPVFSMDLSSSAPRALTSTVPPSLKHSPTSRQSDARLISEISSSKGLADVNMNADESNLNELKTLPNVSRVSGVSFSVADKDPLGEARAKVQKDITREFTILMASGRLNANEAAALATRRVMAKHGLGVGIKSPS